MTIQNEEVDRLFETQVKIATNLQNLLLARSFDPNSAEAIAKSLCFVLKAISDSKSEVSFDSVNNEESDLLAFLKLYKRFGIDCRVRILGDRQTAIFNCGLKPNSAIHENQINVDFDLEGRFIKHKVADEYAKWTAIASRYGKVDFLDFGFDSYGEALAHVKAMNDRTDGYPIAILTPAKDKYWMNSFSDREDVEADLKRLGLSAQSEGTFDT